MMSSLPENQDPDFLFKESIKPRPLSRLTYKILSLNLLVVFILAMGVSYLGNVRKNLIESKLSNLEIETFLYGELVSANLEGLSSTSSKRLSDVLDRFDSRNGQKILIYSPSGQIVSEVGVLPQREIYALSQQDNLGLFKKFFLSLADVFSVTFHLEKLPHLENVESLVSGEQATGSNNIRIAAWSSEDGGLVLTSFVPLYENGKITGGLRIVRRDLDVEDNFSKTRFEILRFLVIALLMTVTLSLYLSGLIGHPLRKLAMAAEAYRLNRTRRIEIPDMSDRQDEIGELAYAMKEMAQSLEDRISSIEQFAADVSHELKNPLTSLRSALETLPRVKTDEDRIRLMDIAFHDLRRIDRLISDISKASRLDAELSRTNLVLTDLRDVILPLIESYRDPAHRGTTEEAGADQIVCTGLGSPVYVYGQQGRLEQVFQNLIGNAISFTRKDTKVIVSVEQSAERVKITVDDFGQGIPENRLEKVFDRFYSERPTEENFGMHSGLGLSIAKQIIDAHGGLISAENRYDESGNILGARFIVRLKGVNEI